MDTIHTHSAALQALKYYNKSIAIKAYIMDYQLFNLPIPEWFNYLK